MTEIKSTTEIDSVEVLKNARGVLLTEFRARTQCPVWLGLVYALTDDEADKILGLYVTFTHSENKNPTQGTLPLNREFIRLFATGMSLILISLLVVDAILQLLAHFHI